MSRRTATRRRDLRINEAYLTHKKRTQDDYEVYALSEAVATRRKPYGELSGVTKLVVYSKQVNKLFAYDAANSAVNVSVALSAYAGSAAAALNTLGFDIVEPAGFSTISPRWAEVFAP